MSERNTRYFIACAALWSVCSVWYDLHEEYYSSSGRGTLTSRPPDALANIALEIAHDPCDVLGVSYARTIESFADYWIPEWVNVLSSQASRLVSRQFISELFDGIQYLYLGFVSSVAHKFCVLAVELEVYGSKHKAQYDQIIDIAQEMETGLAQFEAQVHNDEVVEKLKRRRLACTSKLLQIWEEGVMEGGIDQESTYIRNSM